MELTSTHLCLLGFIALLHITKLVGTTEIPDFQLGCPIPYFGEQCKLARPGRECDSDTDCYKTKGKNFKCCVSWCHGTTCVEQKFKPGACPLVDPLIRCIRKADNLCGVDSECPLEQLCCATPCGGSSCQNPAVPPQVKFGCPFPPREPFACPAFIPTPECSQDSDCEEGELCCTTGCGFIKCLAPNPKPGNCPPLRKILCTKADILRCGVDSECDGTNKCCRTECGGSKCKGPCEYKGVQYKEGDRWQPDPCTTCQCVEGRPLCASVSCVAPPCKNYKIKPETCCDFICPGCQVGDIVYEEGQSWTPSPCEHCTCINGEIRCLIQDCPAPPCENYKIKPGTCCDYICSGCQVGDMIYEEGQSWNPSPCEHCTCDQGKVICAVQDCAAPPCENYKIKPGTCCNYICSGCQVGDMIYEEGQSWNPSPCEHCTCDQGKVICAIQDCAPPPCENYKIKPGTCCDYICSGCQVGDMIYEEGQSWNPSPCEHCTCDQGKVICAVQACVPPPCKNYKIKPGTCCDYICSGCQVGDMIYNDGQSWNPSPCEHCTCDQGKQICALQACAPPPCTKYTIKPGTCCQFICEPDLPPGPPKLRKGCPIPSFGPKCALVKVGRFCNTDQDCKDPKEKCCVTDCGGTACIAPDFKPGVCPKIDKRIQCVQQDDIRCGVDSDCEGRSLCCITPCGGSKCKDPAGFPEARIGCPLPKRPIEEVICIAIPPVINCKSDSDCKPPQICCHDACGNIKCVDPFPQKPGNCPKVPFAKCIQADVITCGVDSECGGDKKCCRTPCSGSECQDPENGQCKDNEKWRETIVIGHKKCNRCKCKNLKKRFRAHLAQACKEDIKGVRKACCKTCKNVLSYDQPKALNNPWIEDP